MVDNNRLAPLGSMKPSYVRALDHAGIHQEVVDLFLAYLLQHLLGKAFDGLEVGEVKGQHRHRIGGAVKLELVKRGIGGLGISCAKNDPIGLRML